MGVERVDYTSETEYQQALESELQSQEQWANDQAELESYELEEYIKSLEPTFVCKNCNTECEEKLLDESRVVSSCCNCRVAIIGEVEYDEDPFSRAIPQEKT